MYQSTLETPLGSMIAIGSYEALYLLEFADRLGLDEKIERLEANLEQKIIPGKATLHDLLAQELAQYFAGKFTQFTIPLQPLGTPFQERVWNELRNIAYGQTISYRELAARIGKPNAHRAVGNANGANPLCILIPCHRVVYSTGACGGYSGGVDRKPRLLALET
jgi:AraC family transcriptional regulator of adaptative response/methylated-DNA-[protein]-cysteine methyltransferase